MSVTYEAFNYDREIKEKLFTDIITMFLNSNDHENKTFKELVNKYKKDIPLMQKFLKGSLYFLDKLLEVEKLNPNLDLENFFLNIEQQYDITGNFAIIGENLNPGNNDKELFDLIDNFKLLTLNKSNIKSEIFKLALRNPYPDNISNFGLDSKLFSDHYSYYTVTPTQLSYLIPYIKTQKPIKILNPEYKKFLKHENKKPACMFGESCYNHSGIHSSRFSHTRRLKNRTVNISRLSDITGFKPIKLIEKYKLDKKAHGKTNKIKKINQTIKNLREKMSLKIKKMTQKLKKVKKDKKKKRTSRFFHKNNR